MEKNILLNLSLKHLLKNEAYLGEKTKNRNPKNISNILATRKSIDIINLQKTLQNIEPVLQLITDTITNYEQILIVAQHPGINKKNYPQPLLTDKWVHGAFSNFKTIKQSKKNNFFTSLNRIPNLIILLHTTNFQIILNEIKYLEIPTIAFLDTADDPSSNLYIIPTNNKSEAIINLYLDLIAKAIFYGYAKRILKFKQK